VSRQLRANLLLLTTALIWGSGFVAQRLGAQILGPFAFNGLRFALGAASLLPLIVVSNRSRACRANTERPATKPGLLLGTVLFVAATLQQAGLTHTTAGRAAFITGLYLIIVPVLGLFIGQHIRAAVWPGIALALGGLFLLTGAGDTQANPGDWLVLIGAFAWAIHMLLIDHFRTCDSVRLAATQFTVCSAGSLLAAVLFEPEPFAGTSDAIGPLLWGGVLTVGVAYTFQIVAQRDAKPTQAAIILSLETVFGAVGGALLLNEQMTTTALTGCALMLGGTLVVLSATRPQSTEPASST